MQTKAGMELLINLGKTKNVISTITIGGEYYDTWEKNAFPLWEKYCDSHNLGLVVFKEDLLSKEDPYWKKPTWQKLLIGRELKKSEQYN